MLMGAAIVITLTALWIVHFQATCQEILRRPFHHDLLPAVVHVNRLEFPFVREALESLDMPVDYPRVRIQLECDFLALTYLLKNICNATRRLSHEERLLALYFRVLLLALITAHILGLDERAHVLRLASVLEYFTNVVGNRVNLISSADMAASDYLLTI